MDYEVQEVLVIVLAFLCSSCYPRAEAVVCEGGWVVS